MLKNAELVELLEYICDDAGMIIGYWADEATNNPETQTYSVIVNPSYKGDEVQDKVLTYENIYNAIKQIANEVVSANDATKIVCEQIAEGKDLSDVDYDATDADVIIQVAMFGEILFG